ncbi:MAG: glycosyltransferase [Clostridia bacterium]
MKVILDGLVLFLNNSQAGDYSRSIVNNLIKYSNLDLDIIKDYEITSKDYLNNRVELFLDRKSNDYSNLSFLLKNTDYNLYHCLNNGFSIPNNFDFNYIMNINNLLPMYDETLCSSSYTSNYFLKLPYGVLNSSKIICSSMSSKNLFLKNFSIDEDKVFVNYGVLSNFYRKTDKFLSSVYIKSKFDVEDEFIVFSGDFHKRKKIEKALHLFSNLKKQIPKLKFLILSNNFKEKKYADFLNNLSKKLNVYNDVIYISNVSVIDKVNIFSNCLLFIDLSVYEDVNLDIIEAFSCKAPIICSNICLYKEYFGDFAFYYDDKLNYKSVLDFVYTYKIDNLEFVLDKFKSDISLKSTLNVYGDF